MSWKEFILPIGITLLGLAGIYIGYVAYTIPLFAVALVGLIGGGIVAFCGIAIGLMRYGEGS